MAFGSVLITGIGSGSASAASLSDYGFVVAGGTDEPFQAQLSTSGTVKAIPIAATGTFVGTLGITPGSSTVLVVSVSTSEPGGLPAISLRADGSVLATQTATTSPNANATVLSPYELLVTVSGGKSVLDSINPDSVRRLQLHKDLVLSGSVLTATTTGTTLASNVTSAIDTTNAVAGLSTGFDRRTAVSNWQAITLANVTAIFVGTFVLVMLALGAALSFGRGRTTFRLPRSADFLNT